MGFDMPRDEPADKELWEEWEKEQAVKKAKEHIEACCDYVLLDYSGKYVNMDGCFELEDLEAIVVLMKNSLPA